MSQSSSSFTIFDSPSSSNVTTPDSRKKSGMKHARMKAGSGNVVVTDEEKECARAKTTQGTDVLTDFYKYTYHLERVTRDSKSIWHCTNYKLQKCPARAHSKMVDDCEVLTQRLHEHTCETRENESEVRDAIHEVKVRARSSTEKPAMITHSVKRSLDLSVAEALPSKGAIASVIKRVKTKGRVAEPTSLKDLQIPQEYLTTLDGEPFV